MGKDLEIVEFEGEMSHRATMPRKERGIQFGMPKGPFLILNPKTTPF
jgi:hypothetical protein